MPDLLPKSHCNNVIAALLKFIDIYVLSYLLLVVDNMLAYERVTHFQQQLPLPWGRGNDNKTWRHQSDWLNKFSSSVGIV